MNTPLPLDAVTLAARVAELEDANVAATMAYADARVQAGENAAHANALRDALVKSRDLLCEDGDWLPGTSRAHKCITAALAAHPAASLAAHDAEVLERAGAMLAQLVAQGNAGHLNAFGDGLVQGHKNALEVVRALAMQEEKP